ncbi:MAG: C25 family cysteine peptidase [Planctomycetota bacterium]
MSERHRASLFSCVLVVSAVSALGSARAADGTVSITIDVSSPDIRATPRGHEVSIEGFGRLLVPGKPDLPAKIFAIAIPPGAHVTSVTFEASLSVRLGNGYEVPPAGLPRVIGEEKPELYARDRAARDANERATYGSDDFYPSAAGEFVRTAGYRKYSLVDVRITPVLYRPKSGTLIYHPQVTVHVDYMIPEGVAGGPCPFDNQPRTEATARDIIVNYPQVQSWYRGAGSGQGLYDFVIITLPALTAAVQPIVNGEIAKGRTVQVVTTDWIASTYTGYDLAEKMRNFLRDKYPTEQWGIEDVLLVGHRDQVPMRRCYQDVGYGMPETDYYFAELSLADSDSWDKDRDRRWGEDSDPIDFYTEVNVGRVPWSDAATVQHICEKSVAFENQNDPDYKMNILLLGSFFWPDTDNAVLMEYKTDPDRHPWMADWHMTRLYEQGYSSYPSDYDLNWNNVKSVWSTGKYAFVNWAGHGSPWSSHIYYNGSPAFVDTSTCPYLNDSYPSIIFADACSNSDTDATNIGMEMLKRGGVGFLGATKVAFGMPGWWDPSNGSSQSLDYYFTMCVTSGDLTQGGAHQWCLRKMYTDGLFYYVRYEMFEWGAYWGNPDLVLDFEPALEIAIPTMPGPHLPPGPATPIAVEIKAGLENYVPGSGRLHYRFHSKDGYSEVALTPLGGDLYEAVLPAVQPGDKPEFYLSAQGDGGTEVRLPFSAPAEVFSCDVCIVVPVLTDSFETNRGWTVTNTDVITGAWERGDPEGTVEQPEDDYTPDGTQCYVTGLAGGSPSANDVDGGPTELTSPSFDLSDGNGEVSFRLWFHHDHLGRSDPLEISISNTNGITWTSVMTIRENQDWALVSFLTGNYLYPSPGMLVRFSVGDTPDDSVVEAAIDDFRVVRYDYGPSLWADTYEISVVAGGAVNFVLDAGATHANRSYLLLGSFSGCEPGFVLPGGEHVPLNWDFFTAFVLRSLGSPVFQNFMGVLDAGGQATATFDTLGPVDPVLTGTSVSFAYLLTLPPAFDFASIPISLTFTP